MINHRCARKKVCVVDNYEDCIYGLNTKIVWIDNNFI